jgi:hypothetical protein
MTAPQKFELRVRLTQELHQYSLVKWPIGTANICRQNAWIFVLLSFMCISLSGCSGLPIVTTYGTSSGHTYYINNQEGSNCTDTGPHTKTQPWCTFIPINNVGTFLPGDNILLASGATWDQEMILTGSGTLTSPIVISSYGYGARPKILRNQKSTDIGIYLLNASHWNISNLEIGRAGAGILFHYSTLSHEGINLNNIYVHDNKGIWSGYTTEYPVSGNVKNPQIADLRININLSSGILFNSNNITLSSSQYILKDVSISDIVGTHNLDSISFDYESDTTDGDDAHNAFQKITFNKLKLFNDDGNSQSVYQEAGLGCSDSLRLAGVSYVTLINSVLDGEAACYTASGTAAIFLTRISNANFVNNIVKHVPETGSPDEVGVDLEAAESNINMYANLFSTNAGAGIEITNTHGTPFDHSDNLDFSGNSFFNDTLSNYKGASSIWQCCSGSGQATPTGLISNNIYNEPSPVFWGGKNIGAMAISNNTSVPSTIYYAAEQFSGEQGENQWFYMYESPTSVWATMPTYSVKNDEDVWKIEDSSYIGMFDIVPAACLENCDTSGVARVFVAPYSGVISIRGRVLKSDIGGTGVYAAVNFISKDIATQIWPISKGKQFVAGTDQIGYATDVDNISIIAGDMIRFEVHANGDSSYDATSWSPAIAYTSIQ